MWNSLRRFWLFDDPRSYGARAILCAAADGLRSIGKDVRLCPFDPSTPNAAQKLRNDLEAFRPDVILLANHPSSLFLKQIDLAPAPCQMMVWLFDDPFLMGSESFSSEEIVLLADPAFETGARERGAKRTIFLPVAAPLQALGDYRRERDHAVVYVGAAATGESMRSQLPSDIAQYLERIIHLKVERPGSPLKEILEEHPIAPGKRISLNGQLAYYLYVESNRLARLKWLQPLARFGLTLYGNEAWKPQIKGTELEPHFQGPIDPFGDYLDVIVSSRININLRSLQGYAVPTQRDFLVPRSGGFLLSTARYRTVEDWCVADPQDLFHLNEFPWSPEAADEEQLIEQVQFYLHHESFRIDWIHYASAIIEDQHTFAHRMEQLGHLVDLL